MGSAANCGTNSHVRLHFQADHRMRYITEGRGEILSRAAISTQHFSPEIVLGGLTTA
jgi:hypothetical protein